MALPPEEMDFISNFSTFWAVFLGAILATIGGFAATQLEWYIEQRRREKNAALFFGEVLSTLIMLINFADRTKKIGDPYGPITMRTLRSSLGEIEIYNRNRETLYDLRDAELRAKIHTLTLRIKMSVDGVSDTTTTIAQIQDQMREQEMSEGRKRECEERMAALGQAREGGYGFLLENCLQLREVVKALEPIAGFSYDTIEATVRNV